MRLLVVGLVGLAMCAGSAAQSCLNGPTPCYTSAGIVNSADYQAGELAPGAIGTIFGTGLAYTTRGLLPSDILAGTIPTVLPGTGVHVLVDNIPAGIFYVSPAQINFQIPNNLRPGAWTVQVVLDANAGPLVSVSGKTAAPGLYQRTQTVVIATRPDGSLYEPGSPAHPGDWVILYATGLGQTTPQLDPLQIPTEAWQISQPSDLQIFLNNMPVDPSNIGYAGVAPGFAGLYQINFKLPAVIPANPEIQVSLAGSTSIAGVVLPATP